MAGVAESGRCSVDVAPRTIRDLRAPWLKPDRGLPRVRPETQLLLPTTAGLRSVGIVGNHLPRQCGIATFTGDLADAVHGVAPDLDCFVLAMNEPGRTHRYPERVRWQIGQNELADYRRAADFLHAQGTDLVSVQHEYGIFGGSAGAHVLALIRGLRVPVVSTLHTILATPNPAQRASMDELTRLSQRVVVMSSRGRELLMSVHGVPADKIDVIPHGIMENTTPYDAKERLGLSGKSVIFTFGLLSPDKGIEHVIDALPQILERHPNTVYLLVGATHPHVKERDGELYRRMLEARAAALGVTEALQIHDRFVSPEELARFMAAADVYVTPYLKPEQITSGTLAYAVGSGKAVISTPYAYASELLSEGRGILVPWRDADAIAKAANQIFSEPTLRTGLEQAAAKYGASMRWPEVARAYLRTFERARTEHHRTEHLQRPPHPARMSAALGPTRLPELELEHLSHLTDDTGLVQHATFDVPRYQDGYCLDDNARALLLVTKLGAADHRDSPLVRTLESRYLAFVAHAFDASTGRFRNFMSYGRMFTEAIGSEDSHGRALWALGTMAQRTHRTARRSLVDELFVAALPATERFSSPRAWAYTLLGLDAYLRAFAVPGHLSHLRSELAARLLDLHRRTSEPSWPWFETKATYANARLPQALLLSGAALGDQELTRTGLLSLGWLAEIQRSSEGHFAPVGSEGFFPKGGSLATFDQQPIEASSMVSACLTAHRLTGDRRWAREAERAFSWFLGKNHLALPLHDPSTGGCRDGLHETRANENQGAESTLSFLLALIDVGELRRNRMNDASDTTQPRHA